MRWRGRGPSSRRLGYLADLLDVEVHQLAGSRALIAAYHPPGGPVDPGEPVQPVAAKDPPDGRRRHPGASRQIHRPAPRAAPQTAVINRDSLCVPSSVLVQVHIDGHTALGATLDMREAKCGELVRALS